MNVPETPLREFVTAFAMSIGLSTRKIEFISLAGDGSKRLFWRIVTSEPGTTFVTVENVPADAISRRENFAYLMIGKHLFQKGLPVPKIHEFDLENGWFILEDMGDKTLRDTLSSQRSRIPLYQKVVEILFRLQIEGSQGFNTEWCFQTRSYDQFVMRRYEADYFRDSFLSHYLGLDKEWPQLEAPFDHLAQTASRAENHFFLHRDFQSKNIMVAGDRIGILDWQGGRLGPLPYDLASLIIDPYTDLDDHERNRIYEYYLEILQSYESGWARDFKEYFPYLAVLRNLQILGAFSFLSKVQGKLYFEAYIPPALRSLRQLLTRVKDPKLDPLKEVVDSLPGSMTPPQPTTA